jgi:hypothetical protein
MVAIAEYDVHTDSWIRHDKPAPEAAVPSARQLWREAVAQAAEKARAALPEANGRIDCAVALVLQGDVELLADGSAKVGSQRHPETLYHVNDACQCQDFARAPHGGQCKHRIARGLAIRAQQRLEEQMDHLDSQAAQPAAAPAAASLPEAPASANAFVMLDGHRVQITVRGHSLAGVLHEIRTVLAQFPAEAVAQQPPTPPAQPAAAAPAAQAQEPEPMPRCPLHPGELMRLNTKNGQQWHSHRLADGTWCKGRPKGGK